MAICASVEMLLQEANAVRHERVYPVAENENAMKYKWRQNRLRFDSSLPASENILKHFLLYEVRRPSSVALLAQCALSEAGEQVQIRAKNWHGILYDCGENQILVAGI